MQELAFAMRALISVSVLASADNMLPMVWYGIQGFNVALNTVLVISETGYAAEVANVVRGLQGTITSHDDRR